MRCFAPGFASRYARLLRRGSPVLGASRLRLLYALTDAIVCRPTLRSGLNFLFVLHRWLRGYAAPPPAILFRPGGSNLGSPTARNLFFSLRYAPGSRYARHAHAFASKSPKKLGLTINTKNSNLTTAPSIGSEIP